MVLVVAFLACLKDAAHRHETIAVVAALAKCEEQWRKGHSVLVLGLYVDRQDERRFLLLSSSLILSLALLMMMVVVLLRYLGESEDGIVRDEY